MRRASRVARRHLATASTTRFRLLRSFATSRKRRADCRYRNASTHDANASRCARPSTRRINRSAFRARRLHARPSPTNHVHRSNAPRVLAAPFAARRATRQPENATRRAREGSPLVKDTLARRSVASRGDSDEPFRGDARSRLVPSRVVGDFDPRGEGARDFQSREPSRDDSERLPPSFGVARRGFPRVERGRDVSSVPSLEEFVQPVPKPSIASNDVAVRVKRLSAKTKSHATHQTRLARDSNRLQTRVRLARGVGGEVVRGVARATRRRLRRGARPLEKRRRESFPRNRSVARRARSPRRRGGARVRAPPRERVRGGVHDAPKRHLFHASSRDGRLLRRVSPRGGVRKRRGENPSSSRTASIDPRRRARDVRRARTRATRETRRDASPFPIVSAPRGRISRETCPRRRFVRAASRHARYVAETRRRRKTRSASAHVDRPIARLVTYRFQRVIARSCACARLVFWNMDHIFEPSRREHSASRRSDVTRANRRGVRRISPRREIRKRAAPKDSNRRASGACVVASLAPRARRYLAPTARRARRDATRERARRRAFDDFPTIFRRRPQTPERKRARHESAPHASVIAFEIATVRIARVGEKPRALAPRSKRSRLLQSSPPRRYLLEPVPRRGVGGRATPPRGERARRARARDDANGARGGFSIVASLGSLSAPPREGVFPRQRARLLERRHERRSSRRSGPRENTPRSKRAARRERLARASPTIRSKLRLRGDASRVARGDRRSTPRRERAAVYVSGFPREISKESVAHAHDVHHVHPPPPAQHPGGDDPGRFRRRRGRYPHLHGRLRPSRRSRAESSRVSRSLGRDGLARGERESHEEERHRGVSTRTNDAEITTAESTRFGASDAEERRHLASERGFLRGERRWFPAGFLRGGGDWRAPSSAPHPRHPSSTRRAPPRSSHVSLTPRRLLKNCTRRYLRRACRYLLVNIEATASAPLDGALGRRGGGGGGANRRGADPHRRGAHHR